MFRTILPALLLGLAFTHADALAKPRKAVDRCAELRPFLASLEKDIDTGRKLKAELGPQRITSTATVYDTVLVDMERQQSIIRSHCDRSFNVTLRRIPNKRDTEDALVRCSVLMPLSILLPRAMVDHMQEQIRRIDEETERARKHSEEIQRLIGKPGAEGRVTK